MNDTWFGRGSVMVILVTAALFLSLGSGCDDQRPARRAATGRADSSQLGASATPGKRCGEGSWAQLSTAQRALWTTLGWTQSSWAGETTPPSSEKTAWQDLSARHQRAAVKLGCEEATWNAPLAHDELPHWLES